MTTLRKYGAATTVLFPLIARDLVDLTTGATFAAGDTKVILDEGVPANTTNNPVHEGNGVYSLALTAAELTAARVAVTIVDLSSPKVWEDQLVIIETYGHASAQHELDLDLAALTANTIADALLTRAISNVEPAAALRTLYGAVAGLVNKREISGTNLVIYKSDDATVLATIPITTDAALNPIKVIDPP